jgi:hypothetical protein
MTFFYKKVMRAVHKRRHTFFNYFCPPPLVTIRHKCLNPLKIPSQQLPPSKKLKKQKEFKLSSKRLIFLFLFLFWLIWR